MNRQSSSGTIGILKMGSIQPAFRARHGDFVDWIKQRMPEEVSKASQVFDPEAGVLPAPAGLAGLIITGSDSMVTNPSSGDLAAFRWLEGVLNADVPVLGLCYGHQMLGHVLGGDVGPLPGGPEIGVADIAFTAGDDPLFAPCGSRQRVAVIHWQTVLRLPAGAQVLARGTREPCQAVRFMPRVWGVQFHPEFSPDVWADMAAECHAPLREAGLDPAKVVAEARQWREQTGVIGRFAEFAARGA